MKRKMLLGLVALIFVLSVLPLAAWGAQLPTGIPEKLESVTLVFQEMRMPTLTDGSQRVLYLEMRFPDTIIKLNNERPSFNASLQEGVKFKLMYQTTDTWQELANYTVDEILLHPAAGKNGVYYCEAPSSELISALGKDNTLKTQAFLSYTTFDSDQQVSKLPAPSESNILPGKMVYIYSGASSWAEPELDKALQYGLITDSIKDNMSRAITREELAELAVRLYELCTKTSAVPITPNPFKDCNSQEVLKANKLEIIKGITNDTFDPKSSTKREQLASILTRTIKAISPGADFSTAGAPVFNDAARISSWAQNDVNFMAKNDFIKGSNNSFDPQGITTREQAVLIAARIYEIYNK